MEKSFTSQILAAARCVHHYIWLFNIILNVFKVNAVVTDQQTFENFSYSK
jgi:hypothetical protein